MEGFLEHYNFLTRNHIFRIQLPDGSFTPSDDEIFGFTQENNGRLYMLDSSAESHIVFARVSELEQALNTFRTHQRGILHIFEDTPLSLTAKELPYLYVPEYMKKDFPELARIGFRLKASLNQNEDSELVAVQ